MKTNNPEEINIDDDDEGSDEEQTVQGETEEDLVGRGGGVGE